MTTVLVVEDEVAIADLLHDFLELEGYTVQQAASGTAALACLVAPLPDIVLSDIMLPGMSGVELCYALHANPTTRAIPVVLMSAGHHLNLVGVPYHAFVPKPFVLADVFAVLAQAVRAVP